LASLCVGALLVEIDPCGFATASRANPARSSESPNAAIGSPGVARVESITGQRHPMHPSSRPSTSWAAYSLVAKMPGMVAV
jgi:hypothetical protein